MDKEQLLTASSLLHGNLKNRRENIKEEIIKLSLTELDDKFTVEDVSQKCRREFDVTFNESAVITKLEELEGDILQKNSNSEFKLIDDIEYSSFENILNPVWNEFKQHLQLFTDKADPYYTNEIEPAFYYFFKEFFLEIAESVEELNEYQKETIYTNHGSTGDLIDDAIDRHRITDPAIFREAIRDYLYDPGEALLEFTASCYTAVVNVDLLSKEDELVEFPSIPDENKILILDTNILIALLADSHDQYITAKTICERSTEMGFDLFYLEDTAKELERYIEGTKHEMDGLVSGQHKSGTAESGFVEDFQKKPEMRWDDYLEELKDWKNTLESEFEIVEYSSGKSPNPIVKEEVEQMMLSGGGDMGEREMRRLSHDASLLGIVAEERQYSDWSFGPFVLSFHNQLTQIGEGFTENPKTKQITGGEPLALQPRSWLNYIISFTPAELDSQELDDLSMTVLRTAADFEEEIGMDEYVHTLAPKVGLEKEDEESLKSLLVRHPLYDELEDALENDEGHRAEKVSRKILTDDEYIETVREEREFKDRIQYASSRIEELEEEIDELESELDREDSGETRAVSIEDLTLSNEGEFREGYELVVEEYSKKFADDNDSEFPNPPSPSSNIEEIKTWLETTTASLVRVEREIDDEELKPKLENLLAGAIMLSNS